MRMSILVLTISLGSSAVLVPATGSWKRNPNRVKTPGRCSRLGRRIRTAGSHQSNGWCCRLRSGAVEPYDRAAARHTATADLRHGTRTAGRGPRFTVEYDHDRRVRTAEELVDARIRAAGDGRLESKPLFR